MNPSSTWKRIKRRIRNTLPGPQRRQLRKRAKSVGSRPALPFADISNNNSYITPAMIHKYAENHDVLVVKASEGRTWKDPRLAEFVKAAKDAGLLVAAYHYARPDNGNPPKEEARNFVETCRAAGLRLGPRRKLWFRRDELPGILDYEELDPRGADAEWIHQFMEEYRRLTNHGTGSWRGKRDPVTSNCILYGGWIVRDKVPHTIHALYWLAAYTQTAEPYWPSGLPARYRFMWQYTERGRFVAFGNRDVDRNRFVRNLKLRDLLELAI